MTLYNQKKKKNICDREAKLKAKCLWREESPKTMIVPVHAELNCSARSGYDNALSNS